MWSGPRNLSTAMMRSFGSRADTFVSDEPFYGCFLKATGLDHPMREEVVASYFPTSVHAIGRVLADAGWRADDVDWVIPHNVSARSWEVLLRLAHLPNAKLWTRNIARRGHALAGDNFINLRDAIEAGDLRAGQRALLFSYGYGAHWTALAVEA